MMSLKDFIKSFQFVVDNQSFVGYLVDQKSNFLATSNAFDEEFSIKPSTRKKYSYQYVQDNKGSFFQENCQALKEYNQFVINTKQHNIFLYVINGFEFARLYIVHKYPIIINNQVEAIYTCFQPYGFPRVPDLTFLSFKVELYARPLSSEYKLTAKQRLIIFFLVRNHSYTEISAWMKAFGYHISPNRVNEHITNLKIIFAASDKQDLVSKAIMSGYYSEIPSGLLQTGVYLINDYLFKPNVINCSILENIPIFVKPTTITHENSFCLQQDNGLFDNQLQVYIDKIALFCSQIDDAICVVDLSGNLVANTDIFAYYEIKHNDFIKEVLDGDDKRLNGRYLYITKVNENTEIFIIYQYPIFSSSNQIIGYMIRIIPYIMPSIPKIMEAVFKIIKMPNDVICNSYNFTKKQYVILYFYIRNYGNKEISEILSMLGMKITVHTVNKHLENIKKTLKIHHKSQLMDKGTILCYHLIPSELIKSGVFSLENTLIAKWSC